MFMLNNPIMKFIIKIFIFLVILSNPVNSQILFSEYAEGSSYNKYLEIYNYSSEIVNLDEYAFPSCSNGCDVDGEWDYMNYFPEGASIMPGNVYVITHPSATDSDPSNDYYTPEIAIYSDHQFTYLSNGDDVFSLINIDSQSVIDVIGSIGADPGDGWDVAGIVNATKDHTLVRKSSVLTGNVGEWSMSAGTNSDDSEWIVLDNETWDYLGFHNYDGGGSPEIFGCMCEEASNYMEAATVDDGSCIVDSGCSDPFALNYSGELCLSAEFINEDCDYLTMDSSGCLDETACNYFDFEYQITASNMTVAIVDISNLIIGDIIGVFYVDENGFISCGGAGLFDGEQMALAAWSDDTATSSIDGFQAGDQFIFLIKRDDIIYDLMININNSAPFSNTYVANGFGQITELDISNEFLQDCVVPPLGLDCDGNSTNLLDNVLDKNYIVRVVDVFGRTICNNTAQNFQIMIFNDGFVDKKYILRH